MFSRFNPFQIKIVIVLILPVVLIIGGGYYYLNAMKTLSGGLNINKTEDIDKAYGYSVYSDFYFRVTKYGSEGEKKGEYSRLIPVKTKIGIDFKGDNPKATTNSSVVDESILELSGNDGDVGNVLDELN
ncbi:MAG: hypothetical protein KAI17_25015, partial [Thiotrichaceae bacterium]|nr:hypothetical protein [Thiotrichaceae bacterium]